jgi:glycosyltransferase involved in cell wall biosynthesis
LSRQLRHAVHRLVDPWWHPPIDERAIHHHLMIPDLLLPASAGEADRLHQHAGIPRGRMRIVMNAVSVDDPAEGLPPDLSEALTGRDRLLSVGSFHRVKNQLALIRALAVTPRRVVFIGGRYPDDPGYLDRCRTAAADQHWFFPELPRPLVLSAMRHSSVYVQPSLRETCGLAALEAAALGCRVAVTARGATREYLGDHAWYFDPENADNIRTAVILAAASEDSGALARHVRTRHSPERLGRELEATYRSVVRES